MITIYFSGQDPYAAVGLTSHPTTTTVAYDYTNLYAGSLDSSADLQNQDWPAAVASSDSDSNHSAN